MKGTGFDRSNDGYGHWSPEGESWFLGIGIDEYQDGQKFRKLHNAVKDVMDIGNLLNEHYLIDKFKFLLNDKATRRAIINTLHGLAKKLTENDKLLIYFSGHGNREELDPILSFSFWVPVDARLDDVSSVINSDTIIGYLKKIKARHVFLISDSCYSGSFLSSRSVFQEKADLRYAKELENNKSRWGLFSAKANQVAADGDPGENSPFADAILTVLSQHQNAYINVGLFVNEVARQAKKNAPDQDVVYNPIIGCGDKNGQYIFWRRNGIENLPFPAYPAGRKLANNLPSINKKTLCVMEKSLRKTCELMLKDLDIPIQADRWALRDYCTNKAHITVDLLSEIQGLKEELGQFSLSSGPLFNRVVGIQKKFTQHLSQKQFQFTDTETSAELFQFIKSPLFKTDAKLQESKRIVQQAFEDNLEQKNILRDYLIDISIQLQLLYLILEKIVSSTGDHELPSHIMN